jgi:lysophospholipase L1-like esterase
VNLKARYILPRLGLILFPVLLIFLIEVGLRMVGIGSGARNAFVEIEGKSGYMAFNPDFSARYFNGFVPSVAFNPFLKKKNPSVLRIVTLGGSSTAGFPYQFYYGFPESVSRRLSSQLPDRTVEVINLGMTAINSYTLWDLRHDIASIDPDLVVIYAGHNEYYGSFGAGSTLYSLGNRIALKRLVLKLKRTAIFTGLETLLAPSKKAGARDRGRSEESDRTLMAQVVRDASIEYDDETFNDGLQQFSENMEDVVVSFQKDGIPVLIGSLVSNLSDQAPLGDNPASLQAFNQGKDACLTQECKMSAFESARDLDNIRFRAPKIFNDVLKSIADRHKAGFVDLQPVFSSQSESGIPGSDLFIDHLHPTQHGYELMGAEFARAILNQIEPTRNSAPTLADVVLDPLESSHSALLIERLLADYPFYKDRSAEEMSKLSDELVSRYRFSGSFMDSLASVMVSSPLTVSGALVKAIQYEKTKALSKDILLLYQALFYWQPFNTPLMQEAVALGIQSEELDPFTIGLAVFGANRSNDIYFWNALGALYLRSGGVSEADAALAKAESLDPNSPVMLYNRARLYLAQGDTAASQTYFMRYQALNSSTSN